MWRKAAAMNCQHCKNWVVTGIIDYCKMGIPNRVRILRKSSHKESIMLQKSEKVNMRNHFRDITKMVAVILLMTIACSCTRTIYQERDVVHHDSIYIAAVSVDTIMQRDSIHVVERGDTVTTTIYKYIYKVRERTDTAYIERTDTVTRTEIREVVKTVRRRDWLSVIGALVVGIVIGFVICFQKRGK